MWLGCKVVKHLIGRGRPSDHLDGVNVRGRPQSGLGYPSGHSAVAAALAVVGGRVFPAHRSLLGGVAAAVALMRVYVGAHFPLDAVGGVGLGAAGGVLALLVTGEPD